MPVELFRHIIRREVAAKNFAVYHPSRDLQHIIRYFFVYQSLVGLEEEFAFADGLPGMVFMLDERGMYHFISAKNEKVQQRGYLVSALLEGTYIKKSPDVKSLLGIRFTNEGLYHLLKQSVRDLRHDMTWALTDIFGKEAEWLLARMHEATSIRGKITEIEQFIRRRMDGSYSQNALFQEAVAHIRHTKGQVPIDELARSLKVNYKWLERKFQTYLGVTPKEYARINRFMHAYFDVCVTCGSDLMGIAINNGYYDQNHFTKEFKQFTLRAPLVYVKEKLSASPKIE